MLLPEERVTYFIKPPHLIFGQEVLNTFSSSMLLSNEKIESQLKRIGRDGRAGFMWEEFYAQGIDFKIGGKSARFELPDKDKKGYDGHLIVGNKKYLAGVRGVTDCLKVQFSGNIGGGRLCTEADLKNSLSSKSTFTIICDIRNDSQYWLYWLVENEKFLSEVGWRSLGQAGWTRKKLFKKLKEWGYSTKDIEKIVARFSLR